MNHLRAASPLLVLFVALLLGLSNHSAHARSEHQLFPPVTGSPPVYRVFFTGQADLNSLARDLDIWQVDHSRGFLVTPLLPDQLVRLQDTHRVELAPFPGPSTFGAAGVPGLSCYRTVDETAATLDQLADTYPDLVQLKSIGPSWDKVYAEGPPGHELTVLIAGNRARPGPKFRFFLVGAIHAREMTTTETATRFLGQLLAGYGTDPDATWLLDYGELHVLPIANPDGRILAETGLLWRKNTNADAACALGPPSYSYGVDLNRNSSFRWNSCLGCSSDNYCSQTYRGSAPASEPETQALEAYVASIFADRRADDAESLAPADTEGLLVSLHSYGQYVLFPWGWTSAAPPNLDGLQTLGRKFGYYLDYSVCQSGSSGCFYQTDGTTDDWAYGRLGIPAYTFELGTWFFEDCTLYEEEIVGPALDALRFGFKAAMAPYQWPAGPEVLDVAIAPATGTAGEPVAAGTTVTVTAWADDSRSSGGPYGADPAQVVSAARVTVDVPPWHADALKVPALALDRAFDSPAEAIAFALDTTGWMPGRHLVYVQARDEAGNWGVPSAQFVEIQEDPTFVVAPSAGTQALIQVRPAETARFSLSVTNTGTVTESYTVQVGETIWDLEVPTAPVGPLSPGASAHFTVSVHVPSGSAGAVARSQMILCTTSQPDGCRIVELTTVVNPAVYYFPFVPINSRARS